MKPIKVFRRNMGDLRQAPTYAKPTNNRYTFFNGKPLVFDADSPFMKADLAFFKASENFSVEGHDADFLEILEAYEAKRNPSAVATDEPEVAPRKPSRKK